MLEKINKHKKFVKIDTRLHNLNGIDGTLHMYNVNDGRHVLYIKDLAIRVTLGDVSGEFRKNQKLVKRLKGYTCLVVVKHDYKFDSGLETWCGSVTSESSPYILEFDELPISHFGTVLVAPKQKNAIYLTPKTCRFINRASWIATDLENEGECLVFDSKVTYKFESDLQEFF
ncbi:MAG: hypothetical protein ACTSUE_08980 [Promethearchaeota archaeon]